jgi:hypothetical protein
MSDSHASAASAAVNVLQDNEEATGRVRRQVEDALELANYVVESGVKNADGQPLAFADIATIHTTAAMLGILSVASGESQRAPASVTKDQWIAFEDAYYRLAMATSPVTAETLRNTKATSRLDNLSERTPRGEPPTIGSRLMSALLRADGFLFGYSPAQRFARRFSVIALGFALIVFLAEWRINVLGLEEDAVSVQTKKFVWEFLLPWCYGGLGACAYLLRSAHYFIYQRSFDLRRTPEYINRILLGSISGGAIILFTNYLTAEDDTFTHFGSAALGFIAGYSTDFLFNTIERIVTAIFPKVAVETVPRDSSHSPTPAKPRRPAGQPDAQDEASGGGDGKPKPRE